MLMATYGRQCCWPAASPSQWIWHDGSLEWCTCTPRQFTYRAGLCSFVHILLWNGQGHFSALLLRCCCGTRALQMCVWLHGENNVGNDGLSNDVVGVYFHRLYFIPAQGICHSKDLWSLLEWCRLSSQLITTDLSLFCILYSPYPIPLALRRASIGYRTWSHICGILRAFVWSYASNVMPLSASGRTTALENDGLYLKNKLRRLF